MANHVRLYPHDDTHRKLREYSQGYRDAKKLAKKLKVDKAPLRDVKIQYIKSVEPTKDQFQGTEEPIVCSEFGCNVHLSNREILFGTKCINHQTKKKIDINQVLSYPLKNAI